MLTKIEQTTLGHFKYLPKLAGYEVKEEGTLTIIKCGLGSSMFNIVYGALSKQHQDLREQINSIITEYRGQPFAWWVPPSANSADFTEHMLEVGFTIEATEQAMICYLSNFLDPEVKSDINFVSVIDTKELNDFVSILEPYDHTAKLFYENLNLDLLNGHERLFVGYHKTSPVIISIVYINSDTAGIYSILTKEEARGKGFATAMMMYLMQMAKIEGCKYAILSASSDSGYRIYERLGYKQVGCFNCLEWKVRL